MKHRENALPKTGLPDAFLDALRAVSAWLQNEHVLHATIGGVAVSLLAQPRATQDIDALVWLDADAWQSFIESGSAYGIEPRLSDALDFAARSRVLLLKHVSSGIPVDISLGALEFERELLERATSINISGIALKLPTIEDLIITKAVAQRGKDIADIESLLAASDTLDLARVRFWANQFFEALEAPEMRERLETLLMQSKSK